MRDTDYRPEVAPEGVTVEKYLLAQFRIEYAVDRIVRIDRWSKGDQFQWHIFPSELVNSAAQVATEEGRAFISLEEVFRGRR